VMYFTLVTSKLECPSVIWQPTATTDASKLLFIHRKFATLLQSSRPLLPYSCANDVRVCTTPYSTFREVSPWCTVPGFEVLSFPFGSCRYCSL
jgi:hypothetical protein